MTEILKSLIIESWLIAHFRAAAIDSVIGDFFDDSKSGILSCFLLCGTLQLSDKGGGSALGLLKEKKIDFGVVSGPLEKQEGVRLMPVRKIEDIFVAGRNFLEYTRQKQPLSVLEKVPLIMLDQDTSTRRYVQRFLEQRKVFVHPEFELATSDIIVQFALRNLGVGSVVRDFAKKELDSRELIELKLEEQLPQREFFVVTEEKGGSSLAAQELLRMLSETAEENEGGDRI